VHAHHRAYVNLGGIKMAHEWDFAGGEAEFRKALELDPNEEDRLG